MFQFKFQEGGEEVRRKVPERPPQMGPHESPLSVVLREHAKGSSYILAWVMYPRDSGYQQGLL